MPERRLVSECLLPYVCDECGISEWRGRQLALHLGHRNGIGDDLDNLRLLCPNCHSQTDTYCGRNTARQSRAQQRCRGRDSNPHGVSPNAF